MPEIKALPAANKLHFLPLPAPQMMPGMSSEPRRRVEWGSRVVTGPGNVSCGALVNMLLGQDLVSGSVSFRGHLRRPWLLGPCVEASLPERDWGLPRWVRVPGPNRETRGPGSPPGAPQPPERSSFFFFFFTSYLFLALLSYNQCITLCQFEAHKVLVRCTLILRRKLCAQRGA